MRIEEYRGAPFVDREEEIGFFVEWFSRVPQRILWVYGPKSSGKTTVMEYVVERKLLTEREWWIKSKYWVKYLNLRGKLITSYSSFLDALIVPEEVYEETVERNVYLSLGMICLESKKIKQVKERKKNLFDVLIEEIDRERRGGRIPVLIIDEIQKLRDVYIRNSNGERELLKEFLNFCVRLTKEMHLSHVVILTSNTIFIERIYNDARLKETSEFWKVDHLRREQVEKWLEFEGFSDEEIELVWEYLGGSIPRLIKVIEAKESGRDLKEHLKREVWLAYTEIVDYLTDFGERERKYFKEIAKEIVKKGYYSLEGVTKEKKKLLQDWAEKEILFYDPLELKVTGNSRVYEKALERMIEVHLGEKWTSNFGQYGKMKKNGKD
ncbi:MAG: ATP-binding protein [Desulfonauticus sp.]|nr:ATP-binding protein [Desulfonauticus sp.]